MFASDRRSKIDVDHRELPVRRLHDGRRTVRVEYADNSVSDATGRCDSHVSPNGG